MYVSPLQPSVLVILFFLKTMIGFIEPLNILFFGHRHFVGANGFMIHYTEEISGNIHRIPNTPEVSSVKIFQSSTLALESEPTNPRGRLFLFLLLK